MKRYTKDNLIGKFHKLSNNKQTFILWEALNYMQSYNGRSRYDCVALAMADSLGLEQVEEGIFVKIVIKNPT